MVTGRFNYTAIGINEKLRKWIVAIILFVCIPVTVVIAIDGASWVGQKIPGFSVSTKGRVSTLMDSQWTGYKAGVRLNDHILSYDGIPFSSQPELMDYLNSDSKQLQPVTYTIERQGKVFAIKVAPMVFTWNDFLLTFFSDFLIGFIFIFIAAVIFFLSPHLYGSFILFLAGATSGMIQILTTDYYCNQRFLPVMFLLYGLLIINVTNAHFNLFKKRSLVRLKPEVYHVITLITVTVMSAVYYFIIRNTVDPRVMTYSGLIAYTISFIIAHTNCAYLSLSSKSLLTKKVIRVYNLIFLTLMPTVAYYVCREVFGIVLPRELVLFQALYGVFLPLTIIRFHAIDFNINLNRKALFGIIWSFFVIVTLTIFAMTQTIFNKYDLPYEYSLAAILFCMIGVISFILYSEHSRLFDRLLFHSTYKFKDTIRKVSDRILSQVSQESILESLGSLLKKDLELPEYYFYLAENAEGDFFIQNESNKMPLTIFKKDVEIELNEFSVATDIEDPRPLKMKNILFDNKLSLLLPIKFQNKVVGLVFLGEKSNHSPYSPEDITNLKTVLKATATALVHAWHHHSLTQLQSRLKIENRLLKEEILGRKIDDMIIGEEKDLKDIFATVEKIKDGFGPVLLRGESGVGKEIIARAIHDRSGRVDQPFIAINCAALPDGLLESELFGHEKGAFTDAQSQKIGLFEAAQEGTIFLDEIGDISPSLQVKLLRVLQEKEIKRVGGVESISVNARVITATNKDLERAVQQQKMRSDFYYRINVLPIMIPPLRERKNDLKDLIKYFIKEFSAKLSKSIKSPSKETLNNLLNYNWPGNVRELQNVIERSVTLCPDSVQLQIHNLEKDLWQDKEDYLDLADRDESFHQQMKFYQSKIIQRAIDKNKGNKTQAARQLGLHVTHLHKKLKQLGDR
jgi:transcriptional regulator with GAF, ATPase, and Fis domain